MTSRKRHAAEAIDLTGDEPAALSSSQPFNNSSSSQNYAISQPYSSQSRPPKQARTGSNPSPAFNINAGSSQANAFLIDDDDEEEDGSQEVPDATQGPNETEYSYGLYGVLPTKIVGCRYYSGYATIGEIVILRREPNNPYDRMHGR